RGQGDGAADSVIVNGTQGADTVTIASSGASVVVNGLAAKVTLTGSEGANDSLTVDGQAGNDTINASGLNAGQVKLTINGGAGNDTKIGSQGRDPFVWEPGDGRRTNQGGSGQKNLQVDGAAINEKMEISANGGHARLTRDVGTITMDLDNVEAIDVQAKAGSDTITVNDLAGTDVSKVNIDLGGADGSPDTVVINATNGDDAITLTNNNGVVTVSGLGEDITINGFEATDRIVINGLAGDDVINASGFTGMQVTENGNEGDDILIGSPGNDMLAGGAGDD